MGVTELKVVAVKAHVEETVTVPVRLHIAQNGVIADQKLDMLMEGQVLLLTQTLASAGPTKSVLIGHHIAPSLATVKKQLLMELEGLELENKIMTEYSTILSEAFLMIINKLLFVSVEKT